MDFNQARVNEIQFPLVWLGSILITTRKRMHLSRIKREKPSNFSTIHIYFDLFVSAFWMDSIVVIKKSYPVFFTLISITQTKKNKWMKCCMCAEFSDTFQFYTCIFVLNSTSILIKIDQKFSETHTKMKIKKVNK